MQRLGVLCTCAQRVGGNMEWVTDNGGVGGGGGKNEKGLIWFGSGEVIIPFPHFTAQP